MERFKNLKNYIKDIFQRVLPVYLSLFLSCKYLLYIKDLYDQGKVTILNGVIPTLLFIIAGFSMIVIATTKAYPKKNEKYNKWFLLELFLDIILLITLTFLSFKYLA